MSDAPLRQQNTLVLRGTLLAVSSLTVMAGATISSSLPAIQAHFADVPAVDVLARLVLTLPALFIALCAPLAGVLVDRWGRKPLLVVCVLLYAAAGVSGVYLDALTPILIGRALLGLAVAGIMTASVTLVADYFEGDQRASFLGLQAGFMAFGGFIFLTAGGFLADISWRGPFFIYLFALVLLPGVLWSLYEPKRGNLTSRNVPDVPMPWAALALIYGFAFVGMIIFYLVPVQLPFYLEQRFSATPAQSGLAIAAMTLVAGVTALLYKRVKRNLGYTSIAALAFLVMGGGYAFIGYAGDFLLVIVGLVVAGLGAGLLMPNANVWATSVAPAAARGRALGGLTAALFLGQFLSPLAVQPLTAASSLGMTFVIVGLVSVGIAVCFLVITRVSRARTSSVVERQL